MHIFKTAFKVFLFFICESQDRVPGKDLNPFKQTAYH